MPEQGREPGLSQVRIQGPKLGWMDETYQLKENRS
jgi:hypothetical protein